MRPDITTAIGKAPPRMQQELTTTISSCLGLLDGHLPEDEIVEYLCSGAPSWQGVDSATCLSAITDCRLLSIAPAPQVISFKLTDLDKAQVVSNELFAAIDLFIVDGGGSNYQFGIDSGYGSKFGSFLGEAIAIARLQKQ